MVYYPNQLVPYLSVELLVESWRPNSKAEYQSRFWAGILGVGSISQELNQNLSARLQQKNPLELMNRTIREQAN
jgi:hypothetical protein